MTRTDYLTSLGLEEVADMDRVILFEYDGYRYELNTEDLDNGTSLKDVLRIANIISCCGEILNKDYMICPICREHN